MAPLKEFRELAAWRLAHQMNLRVDVFLGCPEFRQHFKSCQQLCDAARSGPRHIAERSEEHTSELQSQSNLVCRLLLEKKKKKKTYNQYKNNKSKINQSKTWT